MKIRSLLRPCTSHITLITLVVSVAVFLVPLSQATPADRRTMGLVGRLMRLNPFRHLANFIGSSLDLYQQPEKPPVYPIMAVNQVPGQMQPTHYVKIPTWHPIYYPPRPAPFSMMAPVFQPYPQKYFLHGMSYPVSLLPGQQPQPQQQVQISQAPTTATVSAQPAVVTESTVKSVIQFEPNSFSNVNNPSVQQQPPQPEVTQTSAVHGQVQTQSQPQLVPEEYYVREQTHPSSLSTSHSNSLDNHNQVESPPQPILPPEYSEMNLDTSSSILDSAHHINEMDIATDNINPIQEQLPAPPSPSLRSILPEVDASINSANSMRIILIKPSDMEKLKSAQEQADAEAAVSDFMQGYSMKFIDLAEGAQEMVVTSQRSTNSKPEVENKSCVEPLCDPFLRKLIPELLQSTRKNPKEDEPFVIIKNDDNLRTTSTSTPDYSYLPSHKIFEEYSPSRESQVSVVKAVEESILHDTLEGQSSTLKPQRIHFPRKLISSKINSTFYRNVKPKTKSSLVTYSTLKSPISSTEDEKVLKKLKRFQQNYRTSTTLSPVYRRRNFKYESSESNTDVPLHTLIPLPRTFRSSKETNNPLYSRFRRGNKLRRVAKGEQKAEARSTTLNQAIAGIVFNQEN